MVLLDQVIEYFEGRTIVSTGGTPSAFISRTARCVAAWPSSVMVFGDWP
jgi:hypothetical protein